MRPASREPPVAVRSSALGEDGAQARYAGQQESYLWVRGAEAVGSRARLLGEPLQRAGDHLPRRARDPAPEAAMGVVVQAMVDAEVWAVLRATR